MSAWQDLVTAALIGTERTGFPRPSLAGLPAPAPGLPGPFSLGNPGVLEAAYRQAGFQDITIRTLAAPVRFPTAADCVLFTASDAYLRDFHLIVPDECVASIDPRHTRQALAHMHRVLKAEVASSTTLSLSGQAA